MDMLPDSANSDLKNYGVTRYLWKREFRSAIFLIPKDPDRSTAWIPDPLLNTKKVLKAKKYFFQSVSVNFPDTQSKCLHICLEIFGII